MHLKISQHFPAEAGLFENFPIPATNKLHLKERSICNCKNTLNWHKFNFSISLHTEIIKLSLSQIRNETDETD